ncbi:hypothetical protein DFA_00780 [Cavenderia fasciculata]|uniref:Uncharacterized protein n=1 Tax=Cavenderia fasciculata TaxID=261658 RepID=F4PTT4_CACFS|nr:uncharacterized protein DFA_00780 [Cavenderia fasciculata]EGG20913.1 hypothetical protein DFA_00780 [Cavenderia fasciculata]|eukprot:XP_004358763.1 hypothetical protein DFA_00780 [Cavenderia fasciculata]
MNSLLPHHIIDYIINLSWNSYICTCWVESSIVDDFNYGRVKREQVVNAIEQTKRQCILHRDCKISIEYDIAKDYSPVMLEINRRRLMLSLVSKRIFGVVKRLFKTFGLSIEPEYDTQTFKVISTEVRELEDISNHLDNGGGQQQQQQQQYNLLSNGNIKTLVSFIGVAKIDAIDITPFSNIKKLVIKESAMVDTYIDYTVFPTLSFLTTSLTSLDLSSCDLSHGHKEIVKVLPTLSLRKLYFDYHLGDFPFDTVAVESSPPNQPLYQSLESISVQSTQHISKIGSWFPRMRHLRMICNEIGNDLAECARQTILPIGIRKISFSDCKVSVIAQTNKQVSSLKLLVEEYSLFAESDPNDLFYMHQDQDHITTITIVSDQNSIAQQATSTNFKFIGKQLKYSIFKEERQRETTKLIYQKGNNN